MTMWMPDMEDRHGARYLAIASALADDIRLGRVRPGDRLPTHRDLADELGLTVGTITRAYAEAEKRGLVRGEVGRGTFVTAPVHPDQPLRIPEGRPESVIDMSLNFPVYMEDPDLQGALRELSRRSDLDLLLRYQPSAGMESHRKAGATWVSGLGLDVSFEDVVVCSGAQHALTSVLPMVARPGDLILTDELTYPGIKALARLFALELEPVAMDEEGTDPQAFQDMCRRKDVSAIYCIPTIHNPTTTTASSARRKEIAEIAVRHGVMIIEDDIHGYLLDTPVMPISSYARDNSYYVTSVSKSLAGGLRVGFVVPPAREIERLAMNVAATIWMPSPLSVEVASLWIEDGTAASVAEKKRKEAAARQKLAESVLRQYSFQSHPNAHHLWLELPAPWRSSQFVSEAMSRGVALTPSETFTVGRGPIPHAVRVSLGAAISRRDLEQGLRVLAGLLESRPSPGPAIV